MGFSVTIASTIVLIGLIAFAGATTASMLYTLNDLTTLTNTLARQKLDVRIELDVINVSASTVHFYVKNTGSETIFLKNGSFNWNSVIVAYNNSVWHSYLIDDFAVLEIKVQGSNVSFNLSTHRFINPGEEAELGVTLPDGAPEIPNGVVLIIFVSHYGVSAMEEGVRV